MIPTFRFFHFSTDKAPQILSKLNLQFVVFFFLAVTHVSPIHFFLLLFDIAESNDIARPQGARKRNCQKCCGSLCVWNERKIVLTIGKVYNRGGTFGVYSRLGWKRGIGPSAFSPDCAEWSQISARHKRAGWICACGRDSSARRARSPRLALTLTSFAQNTETPTHLSNPWVKRMLQGHEISTLVPPW